MKGPNFNRIENDFRYHEVSAEQREAMERIRLQLRDTAHLVDSLVPNGREKSEVFSLLEKAQFHANAGISRHGLYNGGDGQ